MKSIEVYGMTSLVQQECVCVCISIIGPQSITVASFKTHIALWETSVMALRAHRQETEGDTTSSRQSDGWVTQEHITEHDERECESLVTC